MKIINPSQFNQQQPQQLNAKQVIEVLNQNLNILKNQVGALESSLIIWTDALMTCLDEKLPGFKDRFLKIKFRNDVRETLANREVSRRMGNFDASHNFGKQLDTLKAQAKKDGMLSDYHKGERMYERWAQGKFGTGGDGNEERTSPGNENQNDLP